MDSVNYWYKKIFQSLLVDTTLGVYANSNFLEIYPYYQFDCIRKSKNGSSGSIVFFDQEPMYQHLFRDIQTRVNDLDMSMAWALEYSDKRIIVTSEKSDIVDYFCQSKKFFPIYYFFHAFAALDWYRNYWKDDIEINFEHQQIFISFQHLVNHKRAHRIDFLCRLHEKNLVDHGLISFQCPTDLDSIIDRATDYTEESKEIYQRQKTKLRSLYLDTETPTGSLSTSINIPQSQKAFLQVVTETVYYPKKLHLTEKIFKPIVCKQPFLLLGAANNLEYFKGYGFKTFSDFWDESYDSINDPGTRVQCVVDIIDRLSKLPRQELTEMKKDMSHILEHNFNHFYHDFKHIVADEFLANTRTTFENLNIVVPKENWKKFYDVLTF